VGRQFYISSFQEEIINGSLLGDARLESRSQGNTARLRIHHGWKQKDLVFWKYEILKDLVSSPPNKISCWKNPKTDENYYSWYFHTLTLSEFSELYRIFYPNGKTKKLPEQIEGLLTRVGLSVWVMDDGCRDSQSMILNTQNFSLKENEELIKVLKKKFDLSFKVNKDRNKWRLRLEKQDFGKLRKLIDPYIIPSMKYKLSP